MKDPVIDNEGVSYEREAITEWLNAGNRTSPSTGKELTINDLRPNRALREAIENHLGIGSTVEPGPTPESTQDQQTAPSMTSLLIDQGSFSLHGVYHD